VLLTRLFRRFDGVGLNFGLLIGANGIGDRGRFLEPAGSPAKAARIS